MKELRFPKALYPGEELDAALKVYGRFGKIERDDDDAHWIVRIDAGSRAKERRLAGEIGNYALGLTIAHRGRG